MLAASPVNPLRTRLRQQSARHPWERSPLMSSRGGRHPGRTGPCCGSGTRLGCSRARGDVRPAAGWTIVSTIQCPARRADIVSCWRGGIDGCECRSCRSECRVTSCNREPCCLFWGWYLAPDNNPRLHNYRGKQLHHAGRSHDAA